MAPTIKVDKVQENLKTKLFGKYMFFSREVGSTNDWAKELAELDAPEGTVAIAETQTAGRGRLGRKWHSPKGGLWFSIILKPNLKPTETVKLVFLASLAVAETIRELYSLKAETKWPNDVIVDGRKVCGILLEMKTVGERVIYAVIGVGINVNIDIEKEFPRELWEKATSLEVVLGKKIVLETFFKALLEKMESLYQVFLEGGFSPVLAKWKAYASFLGCEVEVSSGDEKFEGVALDVNGGGALVLKLKDDTVKHVFAGDLSLKIKGC
ncbi:MAG: biotin--[acetyl-CoA-carboxylase] ligase [Candidatus Bathyarchaeota archaeon]|nr:biotin--[acetyl-CoA-carboxylase] ligase [Candidatus Bathyarchaeota archaeon]MDW8040478.1 biotin--[acetyl-CoA-carboxylase] ligase [Nitrososphaerota archaeon]